jgi:hypothetical protein
MSRFKPYLTGTSTLLALSMLSGAIAPMMISAPASAGLFPSQPSYPRGGSSNIPYSTTIPDGTRIPIAYQQANKLIVSPTETVDLTVTVPANIRSSSGALLIPAGSQIVGKLQPASGGSQFVAQDLIIGGYKHQYINAASDVITQTQQVTQGTNTTGLLKGAAIGGGAAAAISAVTGNHNITALKVLGGAAAGTLAQVIFGRKTTNVIVINPNTDLNLTLQSNLTVN